VLGKWLENLSNDTFLSLAILFLVFLLRALLRRTWLTIIVALACGALLGSNTPNGVVLGAFFGAFLAASQVLTLLRFGVLPTIVAGFLASTMGFVAIGSDFSAWYAGPANSFIVLVLALTAWSFWTALGKRKLFKFDPLEN